MTEETTDLAGALSPVLEARGLDLVDVELRGAQLTVFVDKVGGVGLDELGDATRDVSAALDEIDPIPGRYTLSVSSPGLERRLRTPAHFARAVGEKVTVRVNAGTADVRRAHRHADGGGRLGLHAERSGSARGEIRIAYDDVERARTVFEWGPPRSGAKKESRRAKNERVKRP